MVRLKEKDEHFSFTNMYNNNNIICYAYDDVLEY